MATEIKFCGLTRREDADVAVMLDAGYVGVIFAGGPRMLTLDRATEVLSGVPASVRRVGVFGDQRIDEIGHSAQELGLAVVQLHSTFDGTRVDRLRDVFDGEIWTVCRVAANTLASNFARLADTSDGVLLDAYVPGGLGGTGVSFDWNALARTVADQRGDARIILAGGLRPDNVAQAIAEFSPDVVDVSSGVESAPGIKDHQRMRAFRDEASHVPNPR